MVASVAGRRALEETEAKAERGVCNGTDFIDGDISFMNRTGLQ